MIKASNVLFVLAFAFCGLTASCNRADPNVETTFADSLERPDSSDGDSIAESSQGANEKPGGNDDISIIQARYRATEADLQAGKLDSTAFDYSCGDERRGRITYFSGNGKLTLIVHRYAEYDHHSATDRYYLDNDELVFAFLTTIFWSFESGAEGSTRDDFREHRIYFTGGKPVRCLEKKYTVRSTGANNIRPEAVASTAIECNTVKPVTPTYANLQRFRDSGGNGCLEK